MGDVLGYSFSLIFGLQGVGLYYSETNHSRSVLLVPIGGH